jgi:mono/diheme cytochrome c family protein
MTARPPGPRRRGRIVVAIGAVLMALGVLSGLLVAWLDVRGEAPVRQGHGTAPRPSPSRVSQATLERGAYLARAGNCMGCHTVPGGAAYAGGRGIDTPFGAVVSTNITPDARTGIGAWSADEFWRALHHGRSKDGRLLYPAFPYPSFTRMDRADADALYAFLGSVPAAVRENDAHRLRFPYGTQAALAVWRALYFRPGGFEPDARRSAEWNRGRYLVQGPGHCAACHAARDALGGTGPRTEFAGGPMPDGGWYAPSLASPREAGLQHWPREEIVRLLGSGVSEHGAVSGPMAEVVFGSLQHLTREDLGAMATYLAAIPEQDAPTTRDADAAAAAPAAAVALERGGSLYARHCASCHGDQGQGAPGRIPALAGNRAVTLPAHRNLVQIVRHGGFLPATQGNPRPFGMPPYGQVLGNDDIAAVLTFVRQSWGNAAPAVSPLDVLRVE